MARTQPFCDDYSPYGSFWHVNEKSGRVDLAGALFSLDTVLKLKGKKITSDSLSRVSLVTVGARRYYVKIYYAG